MTTEPLAHKELPSPVCLSLAQRAEMRRECQDTGLEAALLHWASTNSMAQTGYSSRTSQKHWHWAWACSWAWASSCWNIWWSPTMETRILSTLLSHWGETGTFRTWNIEVGNSYRLFPRCTFTAIKVWLQYVSWVPHSYFGIVVLHLTPWRP